MNEVGAWDPFLQNTDNEYLCQSIVVNHCRVRPTNRERPKKKQCFAPKLKLIDFYTNLDVLLGQYLEQLFRQETCCCKVALSKHVLTYYHFDGKLEIRFKKWNSNHPYYTHCDRFLMWSECLVCNDIVTPLVPMSDRTWDISFGRYLEMTFYNNCGNCSTRRCGHSIVLNHIRCFAYNNLIIQFKFIRQTPFKV